MWHAADQIVETLPAPGPARRARLRAGLAPPQLPPTLRIEPRCPDGRRLCEPHGSHDRQRREHDSEQTQLELPFQDGYHDEAGSERDQSIAQRPREPVASGVGGKRERRQDREAEERDRRQTGID